EELRAQLDSTAPAPGDVKNLAAIAREAREARTRVAAVEALGRAGPEGQAPLLALLDELPQTGDAAAARREIVPLLRP
ncbi:hypothetical protein ABTL74_19510, partial [Acinetobacter baumannii]